MISSQFILQSNTCMDCGVQIGPVQHRFITTFRKPISCLAASVVVMERLVEVLPDDNEIPVHLLELFHSQIHNSLVHTYHKQQGHNIDE